MLSLHSGLEGKRRVNAVDATGALVPKSGGSGRIARDRSAVVAPDPALAPTETTSKYWCVSWNKRKRRWMAQYTDANGKRRTIGYFGTQEAAARAYNEAIRRAGLEGRRKTNAVDATGALVPKPLRGYNRRACSAVVAPDPARAPLAKTSKFWGVTWNQVLRVWVARYSDANGKHRHIGHFVTEEAAAHAVNAAIGALPPDVQRRRHTNPVVDGQLVPKRRRLD